MKTETNVHMIQALRREVGLRPLGKTCLFRVLKKNKPRKVLLALYSACMHWW